MAHRRVIAVRRRSVAVQRWPHPRLGLVWGLVGIGSLSRPRSWSRAQKRSVPIGTAGIGIGERQRRRLQQAHSHLLVRMRQQVGRIVTMTVPVTVTVTMTVAVVHHVRMRGIVEGRGGLWGVGRCLLLLLW